MKPILGYSNWKQAINEADYKKKLSSGEKIKLFVIDDKTFKVKVVSDVELIGTDGKLSANSWNSLKTGFLNDPVVQQKYPALKDLKTNIVVYSVEKGTDEKDRAEVFTFVAVPRASAPGLEKAGEFIKKEDIQTVVQDPQKANILAQDVQSGENAKVADKPGTAGTSGTAGASGKVVIKTPISLENVNTINPKGPLFAALKQAYFTLSKDPVIAKAEVMSKVKSELKSAQPGDAMKSFIKGISAGFDLKDEYGDPMDAIDQTLADAIVKLGPTPKPTAQNSSRQYYLGPNGYSIFEADTPENTTSAATTGNVESSAGLPDEFNVNSFLSSVGGLPKKVNLGGITLPEGGIKRSSVAAGDENLKKAQQLLIDKLGTVLSDTTEMKNMKKYGADGKYGNSTAGVVKMAKNGFELSDTDGDTITAELISALNTNKIGESKNVLLNWQLVEQFNVSKAKAASGSGGSSGSGSRKSKSSGTASTSGTAGTAGTSGTSGTVSAGSAQEVENGLIALVEKIVEYWNNSENFTDYTGRFDDNEEGAVEAFTHWRAKQINKKFASLQASAAALPDGTEDETEAKSTIENQVKKFASIFIVPVKDGKTAFDIVALGNTDEDTVKVSFQLLDGTTKSWSIDTDF